MLNALSVVKGIHPILRFWRRLVDAIVQDVPEADALCEFDCRKEQCEFREWFLCERRRAKAAGELMPVQKNGGARVLDLSLL